MDAIETKDLPYHQYIASVKYRTYIDKICIRLGHIGGIEYICMAIIFNDARRFHLSNMPRWAVHYYCLGGNRADEVFDPTTYQDQDYFIPRQKHYDSVQSLLVKMEESLYSHYDTFAILRKCSDCQLIFLALHDYPIVDPEKFYHRHKHQFVDFCCTFLHQVIRIIKEFHPAKAGLKIFNDIDPTASR